jgi:hypothetical protein
MKSDLKKSQQRERLIAALLQNPTLEKAAEAAGISVATAWRIRRTEEFEEGFRVARRQAFRQSQARAQFAANNALSVLLRIMMDPSATAQSRVRAAAEVINQARVATNEDDSTLKNFGDNRANRAVAARLTTEQLKQARELALAVQEKTHGKQ